MVYSPALSNACIKQLAILLLVFGMSIHMFSQENSRSVIARSNFIFYGTIIKMNASNIGLSATNATAIVKVDKIIDAVAPYELMEGKEITVLLASTNDKKENLQQVFYTTGWYYGKTLGVKEVRNAQPKRLQDDLQKTIANERVNIHNDSVNVELQKSSLVVIGTVTDVGKEEKETLSMESEHDPRYIKAVIQIKQVLKGKTDNKQIAVFFSGSDDVAWNQSPKLNKGLEAIFLLQLRQAPPFFPVKGFTVLDKRDVQPVSNLSTIRALLKKQ